MQINKEGTFNSFFESQYFSSVKQAKVYYTDDSNKVQF